MKDYTKIIFCLTFFLVFTSCDSDNNFSDTPELTVRSFEQTDENNAVWKIGFTDGDGDLGVRNNSDSDNFIVNAKGMANGEAIEVELENKRIPVVENIRTAKGVEGEFEFRLETDLYRFYTNDLGQSIRVDTLSIMGYVVDRSGKVSNVVETPIFRP